MGCRARRRALERLRSGVRLPPSKAGRGRRGAPPRCREERAEQQQLRPVAAAAARRRGGFGCAECGGAGRVRARGWREARGRAAVEIDAAVAVVVEAARAGRHLVGPDVAAARCAAVALARTHAAALVLGERDLTCPRVAVVVPGAGRARDRVDRRAAGLERVRRRRAAVVLEWTERGPTPRTYLYLEIYSRS
jgi:hypothetical protein